MSGPNADGLYYSVYLCPLSPPGGPRRSNRLLDELRRARAASFASHGLTRTQAWAEASSTVGAVHSTLASFVQLEAAEAAILERAVRSIARAHRAAGVPAAVEAVSSWRRRDAAGVVFDATALGIDGWLDAWASALPALRPGVDKRRRKRQGGRATLSTTLFDLGKFGEAKGDGASRRWRRCCWAGWRRMIWWLTAAGVAPTSVTRRSRCWCHVCTAVATNPTKAQHATKSSRGRRTSDACGGSFAWCQRRLARRMRGGRGSGGGFIAGCLWRRPTAAVLASDGVGGQLMLAACCVAHSGWGRSSTRQRRWQSCCTHDCRVRRNMRNQQPTHSTQCAHTAGRPLPTRLATHANR